MPRLYRPHVPVRVKCLVALKALHFGSQIALSAVDAHDDRLGVYLAELLPKVAAEFGCEVQELRLDHDPSLAARSRTAFGKGGKVYYTPDANDPDHLFYRPHGPEHDGSHLIKTNVRGDHGQHPDRVLIKKARKLERRPRPKRSPPIRSRGFAKVKRPFPKRRKP